MDTKAHKPDADDARTWSVTYRTMQKDPVRSARFMALFAVLFLFAWVTDDADRFADALSEGVFSDDMTSLVSRALLWTALFAYFGFVITDDLLQKFGHYEFSWLSRRPQEGEFSFTCHNQATEPIFRHRRWTVHKFIPLLRTYMPSRYYFADIRRFRETSSHEFYGVTQNHERYSRIPFYHMVVMDIFDRQAQGETTIALVNSLDDLSQVKTLAAALMDAFMMESTRRKVQNDWQRKDAEKAF